MVPDLLLPVRCSNIEYRTSKFVDHEPLFLITNYLLLFTIYYSLFIFVDNSKYAKENQYPGLFLYNSDAG